MKNGLNRRRISLKVFAILFLCIGVALPASPGAWAKNKSKRKILYYRSPMNPSITSDVPAKDSMGMDYIPVYEEEAAKEPEQKKGEKKIKYWTCGMHPQVKQDKPGNCPICNMQLVPVYEEEMPAVSGEEQAGSIKLSQRDISLAGIKSEPITSRELFKEIRTVGKIAYDPELYKAEEEFIQAVKTQNNLENSNLAEVKKRAEALVEASQLKLQLLGLSEAQIDELAIKNQPDRSLIISDRESPYAWVYAEVYEYELSWIKLNQPLRLISVSFPGEEFIGKIEAIDPILNPMTRSVRIRAKIENPKLLLKPQMYVDIFTESYLSDENNQPELKLAVPADAVLDTGIRKIVYLDLGNGRYLGKEIKVGPEASAYIEGVKHKFYPVISGLAEGDVVVTKANFLIDSQSQLSGAAAAYGGALGGEKETAPPAHQH